MTDSPFLKDDFFEELISLLWWYIGCVLHSKTWLIICLPLFLLIALMSLLLSHKNQTYILSVRQTGSHGLWVSLLVTYIFWYCKYEHFWHWMVVSSCLICFECIVCASGKRHYSYFFTLLGSLMCASFVLLQSESYLEATFVLMIYNLPNLLLFTFQRSFTIGEATLLSHLFMLIFYSKPWTLSIASFSLHLRFADEKTLSSYVYTVIGLEHIALFYLTIPFSCAEGLHYLKSFISVANILLCILWSILLAMSLLVVRFYGKTDKETMFNLRKSFHVFAGIVYSSGIMFGIKLLSLASGVISVCFLTVDIIRFRRIGFFGALIDDHIKPFRDDRDSGDLTFTPIALLIGLSLPIWLHEYLGSLSNDLIPWAGVISVAIGDTLGAFVGKRYGSVKWPGSHRSLQGSLASFLGQLSFCLLLNRLRYIDVTLYQIFLPVTFNVMIEAYTSQIDNIILPLSFISVAL